MTNTVSVNQTGQSHRIEPTRFSGVSRADWRWTTPAPAKQGEDTVELSHHAKWMEKLATLPPGRMHVVDRVRLQIACASYETDQKVDIAIERLARDLVETGAGAPG